MKMLLREFRSHHELPASVTGKVVELEGVVITPETRRRYRTLSHIPLGAHVLLCELDLTSTVSPDVIASVDGELTARRIRRIRFERSAARKDRQATAARDAAEASAIPVRPPPPKAEEFEPLPSLQGGSTRDVPTDSTPSVGVSYAALTRLGIGAQGPPLPGTRTIVRDIGGAWIPDRSPPSVQHTRRSGSYPVPSTSSPDGQVAAPSGDSHRRRREKKMIFGSAQRREY